MFQYILAFFLNWGIQTATTPEIKDPVYLDLAIGITMNDLSDSTVDLLQACEHYDQAQSRDGFHYIYELPIPHRKGMIYKVTFSNDYKILSIVKETV